MVFRGIKRKVAAVAVGAATIMGMGVVSAQSSSAYQYSYGLPQNVYVWGVTPVTATPGSTFSTYPTNNYRAITPPSMYVYRNGVYLNQGQTVTVINRLWKYSTYGWVQTETFVDNMVIHPGWSYNYYRPSRQFYTQLPNAYYTVKTEIQLHAANGVWLYKAEIEPNSVNDFACTTVLPCTPTSNSVYVR